MTNMKVSPRDILAFIVIIEGKGGEGGRGGKGGKEYTHEAVALLFLSSLLPFLLSR